MREINKEEFMSEFANSDKPVLIDFYAPWCFPCKSMLPTVESLAVEYADKIDIVKVNIDNEENYELVVGMGVRSVPTLVGLVKNQAKISVVGLQTKDNLIKIIEKTIE